MNPSIAMEVEECEQRLKQAMLQSDVSALDDLLAPDLMFTTHLGQLMTKQDDLEAHRSGVLKIKMLNLSDQKINIYDDVAVTSVHAHISGTFAGTGSEGDFRFTRVWRKSSNKTWQVVAGHSSIVV